MLDMKTKEFTESYFVPMFGEVKPKDEYVTALLIEAGVIPILGIMGLYGHVPDGEDAQEAPKVEGDDGQCC